VARRRIAILGGGMAGLTAALELTRTERLRERFDVTVYQLGWRLGGKCASGVDEHGRNIEHGLHIWFGYYENTFALLNAVYDEWEPPRGQKIRRVAQAIEKVELTPIGNGDAANPGWYMVKYPSNRLQPGKDDVQVDVWNSLIGLMNVGAKFAEDMLDANPRLKTVAVTLNHPKSLSAMHIAGGASRAGAVGNVKIGDTPKHLRALAKTARSIDVKHAWYVQSELEDIIRALQDLSQAMDTGQIKNVPMGNLMSQLVEVKAAFAAGIVKDVLLGQMPIAELDKIEFRAWLRQHGAHRESLDKSPYVKALYDTMFQYPGGDHAKPRFGAGTAAQVVLRMLGTYAGALAWRLSAGTGSAVIAPLYEVLKKRGVKFQFFHKLTQVGLAEREDMLDTLTFDRQVLLRPVEDLARPPAKELPLKTAEEKAYDPLRMVNGLLSWGEEPDWSAIEGGVEMKKAGVDLESHWCQQKVGAVTLKRGADFDDAILAIPLGAFKKLNADGGPCDQLIARSQRFRLMERSQLLVPSVSVQLWSTETLAQLGWRGASPAAVAGPGTLGIWSDMPKVLAHENSGRQAAARKGAARTNDLPKSLHYLCDVFESDDYKLPIIRAVEPTKGQPQAPSLAKRPVQQAQAHVDAQTRAQAETQTRTHAQVKLHTKDVVMPWFGVPAIGVWSKAKYKGKFNWNVLYARDKGLVGSSKLADQVVRFNIDPGGCCVCSAPTTTAWRLKCDASGFAHLYLAGSWIDTGFNTECIEAAVMSGMQAARAIAGEPRVVVGERFLHPEFGDTSPWQLVQDAVSWLTGIAEGVGPG